MAITKEILNSHPVGTLKKEIAKTNVKGYSKMKKAEIVDLIWFRLYLNYIKTT